MVSISYAVRTTNNAAEYQGLLRYTARNKIYELNIAGDSNVILTQLRRRRIPNGSHLKGVYTQCRQLADRLMITSWTHHVRQFNNLADSLANIAMDSRKSTQVFPEDLPTLPTYWATVVESLQGDMDHWIDLHPDTEDDGRSPNIYGVDCHACASA
ncbi:hypothetical protein JG687_00011259 [Phytophthora cactorum]|uniref:RNase H type-1 domain-containing protein n=1 Tax=Phytophthora cactorum TaxID=29920 RepID=A0A8T1U7D8_9STRA|nr:hypothetical protein JG687_00011259 [Phytophthora cactorum]